MRAVPQTGARSKDSSCSLDGHLSKGALHQNNWKCGDRRLSAERGQARRSVKGTHARIFVVQQRVPRRRVPLQRAAADRLGTPWLANACAPSFLDDQFHRPNALPVNLQR